MVSHLIQNILMVLLASYATLDNQGITILNYWPVTVGLVSGLIMGDMHTAMIIGGTFQLMSLGVAALGGASVPDYGLATIVGTFLAVRTHSGIATALGVGLPVGLLVIQLDVLIKILNNFVAHKSQEYAHKKEFNKMRWINWLGPLFFALKNFIPMVIIVTLGPSAISFILKVIPKWITNGLTIAGGMLPVVGLGMLLHYMPTKKYISYVLIGFVLAAYLKISVLGIAIIGLAASIIIYQQEIKQSTQKKSASLMDATVNEGDDYDE